MKASVTKRQTPGGDADALAPLIRNAWYVVALASDVGRELTGLKVLGEPLVLYRTEAGEASFSTIAERIGAFRFRRVS